MSQFEDGKTNAQGGLKERFGFKSIRLTILLTVLITIITAIGSLIVLRGPELFNELTSDILVPWIFNKGRAHLSSIWWIFLLLMFIALVGVNTLICTIDRIKSLVVRRQDKRWLSKRMIYPLFPHIVHIGFFIALIGHVISGISGFKTWDNYLAEGERIAIPSQEDRYLRLSGKDYSSDGEMHSMKASVSVVDGMNRQLKEGVIDINRPFFYKGIAFYHSHHGKSATGLMLEVKGEVYKVNFGEDLRLSDGRLIRLGRLFVDFALDAGGRPYNRSRYPTNPVQELSLIDGDNTVSREWLSIKALGYGVRLGELQVKLAGYSVTPYLVMAINKDPGAKIVFIGSSIFMAGFLLLLFLREDRRELVRANQVDRLKAD